MKNFDKVVNDEQLLDFALSHVSEKNTEEVHYVAHMIMILYIINEFEKNGKESFTEEEIQSRYQELLADYLLTKMSKQGLIDIQIDENGEFLYGITEKGKEKIENEY